MHVWKVKHHWGRRLWQNVAIAPFQVPLMLYLALTGTAYLLQVPTLAEELDVPEWTFYNFSVVLIVGAAISLVARLRSNERLESFGLAFVLMAAGIALILSFMIGEPESIGDELFIAAGCILRMRVLAKAREAERLAISIVEDEANGKEED